MKRLLYIICAMNMVFIQSVSAMTNEMVKKLVCEPDHIVMFDPSRSINFDTESRHFTIPVISTSQDNASKSSFIACQLDKKNLAYSEGNLDLKDYKNIPWKLTFKRLEDTVVFQETYEKAAMQEKVAKIASYIRTIFPHCNDQFKYDRLSFCIRKKVYFTTPSLWEKLSEDEIAWNKDVATCFNNKDYFSDTTPILVVSGYHEAKKTTYHLAIPLAVCVDEKICGYEDFEELSHTKTTADTHLSIQGLNLYRYFLSVSMKSSQSEQEHKLLIPVHTLHGSLFSNYGCENENGLAANLDLKNLLALYEQKGLWSWAATLTNAQDVVADTTSSRQKVDDKVESVESVVRSEYKSDEAVRVDVREQKPVLQDNKVSHVNSSKQEVEEKELSKSIVPHKKKSKNTKNGVLDGGKLLHGGVEYMGSAFTTLGGVIMANCVNRSPYIKDSYRYLGIAIFLVVAFIPEISRYGGKLLNKDDKQGSITLKSELKHLAARAVSMYFMSKFAKSTKPGFSFLDRCFE